MPFVIFLQIILLVLWYALPAMASVPAVVVFLPLLIPAVIIGAFLLGALLFLIIGAIISAVR